jgi:hypothetical protein
MLFPIPLSTGADNGYPLTAVSPIVNFVIHFRSYPHPKIDGYESKYIDEKEDHKEPMRIGVIPRAMTTDASRAICSNAAIAETSLPQAA